MSDKATTDRKTDKEKTVKKRAARSLVAPVKYKPSEGKPPRQSLELTAPIGLTWNEDAIKPADNKPKPLVGTGWPDRPPTPKVPLKPIYSTGDRIMQNVSNDSASDSGPIRKGIPDRPVEPERKSEPIRKGIPERKAEPEKTSEPIRKGIPEKPSKKKEPVKKEKPVKKPEPVIEEVLKEMPEEKQAPVKAEAPVKKEEPVKQERPVKQEKPLKQEKPVKQEKPQGPRVLHSPVSVQEEPPVAISPMQKRPVSNTTTWQGPIQQLQFNPNDPTSGPKFVRTVVTTTTTTYEPISEEVIRQITSQTAPMTVPPEQVIMQQPVMAPVQQPMGQVPQRRRPRPQPRPGQGGQRPGQARPGQGQPRPAQARLAQGRVNPAQSVQQPIQQPQINVQDLNNQAPVSQGGSIIGAMEARGPQGPAKPKTMMDRQLEEIEKALGISEAPNQTPVQGQAAGGVNMQAAGGVNGNVPGRPVIGDKPISVGKPVPEMDKETKKSMEYLMLFVEGIIFIIVLAICISIFQKIKNSNKPVDKTAETAYEETAEPSEMPEGEEETGDAGTEDFSVEEASSDDMLSTEGDTLGGNGENASAPSGSISVDNDEFTLNCTNVTVKLDTEGNPAALIYFSFANKTSEQLALADVFPISVSQNGEACETFAALDEYPEEYYNKDMQISDGSQLSCAYAVSLKDAVSPIVLTVNNNRDNLSEVGTTEIAIQ